MSRRIADLHADWLRLVEPEGQFLTLPVLRRAFPDGLDAVSAAVREQLRERYPRTADPTQSDWDAWFDWLARDALAWGPHYRSGEEVAPYTHAVPEYGVVLRADAALCDPERRNPRALVMRYPHGTPLDHRLVGERWNASPVDRLTLLCRAQGVRIGLLTDGERVMLVWVPGAGAGGHATWETALFTESRERNLFQSFVSLLHASRFFAVREEQQLEALFEASEKAQNEVTGQLGLQVRQAVELLVSALSRSDLERGGALLSGVSPHRVYEAAATVMMRLVFLLYAEERDLLPLADPLYAEHYAASTLREQLDEQAAMEGDEPLERRGAAWFRLLALFRIIYAGLNHDRLRIPPYGGRLFDPDRFAFLEGRRAGEKWSDTASRPLPVDDLTVRAILEAIQTLPIRESGSKERRRLSFRSLDVEQIGHVYEGLLDHGAERVDDVYVGLIGKTGAEAEIPLADLEKAAGQGQQPLVSFLHDFTGKSPSAIEKLIELGRAVADGKDVEARRLVNTVCDNDATLAVRVSPFVYALRTDLHGLPVVFPPESLVVKQTRARRDSGTEYTPRELAEEMVRYALEPLVYSPGPRDGVESEHWRLRPSAELLDLKVCDPAVGSGAFLVSACRYLADRVVEASVVENPEKARQNRDDLTLEARRAVVDRCLYGVDRDPMAVEMAKLSLWLITMARERPFSFLDHSIREGDSLLGISSLDQLRYLHADPELGRAVHARTQLDATRFVQPLAEKAAALRLELESLPNVSVRDAEHKQRLNDDASHLLQETAIIADGVVATAISTATESEKRRNAAFQGFASLVASALTLEAGEQRRDALDRLRARSHQLLNAGRAEGAPPRVPMHWPLAFPEVFTEPRTGFDAIVGNPPFAGNRLWKSTYGAALQSIVHVVLGVPPGKIDLCVAFHRRAVDLLRKSGNYALLAASNIAKGDAISVGLGEIIKAGEIFRSRRDVPWPGTAAVFVAVVCLHKGAWHGLVSADEHQCGRIGPRLVPEDFNAWMPQSIQNGIFAFEGINNSRGLAFVIQPSNPWFEKLRTESNSLLRPYVVGDDIAGGALVRIERWALDIADRDIEEIQSCWPLAFRFLTEVVKPTRTRSALASYPGLHDRWWQFWNNRADLMRRLRTRKEFIAYPKFSKYAFGMIASSTWIYTNMVLLIGIERSDMFALCLSGFFRLWASTYAGGNYGGGSVFLSISRSVSTFVTPGAMVTRDGITAASDFNRGVVALSRERHCGLTEVLNAISSPGETAPAVLHLRSLLEVVDRAVGSAYGWSDLDLCYDFRETVEGTRWAIGDAARTAILERLLESNRERYREESERDLVSRSGVAASGKRRATKVRSSRSAPAQMALAESDGG